MKKARIHITLPPGDTAKVSRGDKVHTGDVLSKGLEREIDEFDLAKLLNVSPKKALTYLTVKTGDEVEKGTVIARKPGLISQDAVKSPVSGVFQIVDPEKAVVGVVKGKEIHPVTAWFSGVVMDIGEGKLTFEVEGQALVGKEGKGVPVSGRLTVINSLTVLDMPIDVDERIVVVKDADSALVAKADALGALAIIAETLEEPPFAMPYVLFEDIKDILDFDERYVLVHGDDKRLLVLDKDHKPKSKK